MVDLTLNQSKKIKMKCFVVLKWNRPIWISLNEKAIATELKCTRWVSVHVHLRLTKKKVLKEIMHSSDLRLQMPRKKSSDLICTRECVLNSIDGSWWCVNTTCTKQMISTRKIRRLVLVICCFWLKINWFSWFSWIFFSSSHSERIWTAQNEICTQNCGLFRADWIYVI